MREKFINTIYIFALFLQLLSVSIPVLPEKIQVCAWCMFLLYLFVVRLEIDKAYYKWTIAYMFFFLVSAIWALNAKLVAHVVVINLFPILLMTFATITFVKKNRSINAILFVLYIVALFMLFYLVTHIDEFIIGVRLSDSLNEEGDDLVWNSNAVGVNLCFALFAGYILFVNQKRNAIIKFLFLLSALVMIFAILLTGSRKSLLILLMPLFFFMYKKQRKHFLLFLFAAVIIVWLVYLLVMNVEVFYEALGVRIEEMINIVSGNTTGDEDDSRKILIEYGLDWFWDNPILGVGINNYRVLSDQTAMFAGKHFYAHNNYVELMVGVGIIGLLIYYSAYYNLLIKLRKQSDTLSIWGIVFLFILFFLGFAEVLYYEPVEQLIFCLIYCILELNNNNNMKLNEKRVNHS